MTCHAIRSRPAFFFAISAAFLCVRREKNLTAKNAKKCRKVREEDLADRDDMPRDSITPGILLCDLSGFSLRKEGKEFNRKERKEVPQSSRRRPRGPRRHATRFDHARRSSLRPR